MLPQTNSGRLTAAAAVIAGLAVFWYLFTPAAVPVDIAPVTTGPLEVTIDEEGVTAIRNVYTISAPVSGLVRRSPLKVADDVSAGETIVAAIAPKPPEFVDERTLTAAASRVKAANAALSYARATVEKAEAELKFASDDRGRAEALFKRKTISQRSLDEASLKVKTLTAALENARADVEVKRRELEIARAQLMQPYVFSDNGNAECCVNVRAPVSGRVLKLHIESAQVVAAGTALMDVGDPRDLEIIVDLLSSDAVKVRQGATATIERWGGDVPLTARVRRIEPAGFKDVSALGIEEQRVKVRLDITGSAPGLDRLGHDYRVYVKIRTWQSESTLRVPVSALFRRGADWAVFVADGRRARLRVVKVGRRNSEAAQILGGLKAGERVVLHPSDRLASGSRIVERKELR